MSAKTHRMSVVRNSIYAVLARHGISRELSHEILDDLFGNDQPRPLDSRGEPVPSSFTIKGVTLHYPVGHAARAVTGEEIRCFNKAYMRAGTSTDKSNLLCDDDTARVARTMYTALWNLHISGDERGESANPALAAVIEEASTPPVVQHVVPDALDQAIADLASL